MINNTGVVHLSPVQHSVAMFDNTEMFGTVNGGFAIMLDRYKPTGHGRAEAPAWMEKEKKKKTFENADYYVM